MANKVYQSTAEAVADIPNGACILVGGFAGAGSPGNLIDALAARPVRDLTIVANASLPGDAIDELFAAGQVRKFIATVPISNRVKVKTVAEQQIAAGDVELEVVPQGTLVERIRCGGAGIPAFYTPVGAGTILAEGKEVRTFGGRECLLETAIQADVALIRARVADTFGNLTYRASGRNFNPVMAMAAKTVIVEVESIVDEGELDPEHIVTPGIFVDRIVKTIRRVERGR